jgi:hypothetical protein
MTVPESIKHADLQKAMKPLYDLLGVDSHSTYIAGFTMFPGLSGSDYLSALSFCVTARASDDESERPRGLREVEGIAPQPQPYAELAWPCIVKVV